MTTPLDRAAKALAEEIYDHRPQDPAWQVDVMGDAARAALAAIREPTPEMIEAGKGVLNYRDPVTLEFGASVGELWRTMHDAMMAEEKEPAK